MERLLQRRQQVPLEFDRVAQRYDLLNAFNPGYNKHLRWSAERMGMPRRCRLLDLCCGTGLSTQALATAYPEAEIVALDGSRGMLDVATRKPAMRGMQWIHGDAMNPRGSGIDGRFDGIFMAYGIRNMSDPDRCLNNILDLLEPGGVVAFHEYSVDDSRFRKAIWNVVASAVIIPFGLAATGNGDLFRYLRHSVNRFDDPSFFRHRLSRAGFVNVVTGPMDGWQRGIVHTFVARKPA